MTTNETRTATAATDPTEDDVEGQQTPGRLVMVTGECDLVCLDDTCVPVDRVE